MVTGSSGLPYTEFLQGAGSGRRLRTVRTPAHTDRRVSFVVDSLHSAIKAVIFLRPLGCPNLNAEAESLEIVF